MGFPWGGWLCKLLYSLCTTISSIFCVLLYFYLKINKCFGHDIYGRIYIKTCIDPILFTCFCVYTNPNKSVKKYMSLWFKDILKLYLAWLVQNHDGKSICRGVLLSTSKCNANPTRNFLCTLSTLFILMPLSIFFSQDNENKSEIIERSNLLLKYFTFRKK